MFLTKIERKILPYDQSELVETEICISDRDIVGFEPTPKPVRDLSGNVVPCVVCHYETLQPDRSHIHRTVCVRGSVDDLTALRFPNRVQEKKVSEPSEETAVPNSESVAKTEPSKKKKGAVNG